MPLPVVAAAAGAAGGSAAAAGGTAAAGAGASAAGASGAGAAAGAAARGAGTNITGLGNLNRHGPVGNSQTTGLDNLNKYGKPGEPQQQTDKFGKGLESATSKVQQFGNNMEALAKNDMRGLLSNILPESLRKFAGVVFQVTDSFIQRGRELSGFSGELAYANAMANVKNTLADMEEAQRLGPGIAEMTTGANDIELAFRRYVLPMKEFLVNVMGDVLGKLGETISFLERNTRIAREGVGAMLENAWNIGKWANTGYVGLRLLSEISENTKKESEQGDLAEMFKKALDMPHGGGLPRERLNRGPREAPGGMNIPLFGGI